MKNVYIKLKTHNDLDGVGAGILAKLAFTEHVDVTYCSYNNVNQTIQNFLEKKDNKDISLFITDLVVNQENEQALDSFHTSGGSVCLFDHHMSAEHMNKYDWAKVKSEEKGIKTCATSLFYAYLVQEKKIVPTKSLNDFVELVRLYDTWDWDKERRTEAKRLNDLLYIIGVKNFESKMIERLTEDEDVFVLNGSESMLLDLEEEKIERYVKQKQNQLVETYVEPYFVGVVHADQYTSEVGNRLGNQNPHLDAIVLVNVGTKRMSIRSIHPHVDVATFAISYNGGGHKSASGADLTEKAFVDYVLPLFHTKPRKKDALKNKYNKKECKYGVLYENNKNDYYWIKPKGTQWQVEEDGESNRKIFSDYNEAERYLKRTKQAALSEDSVLIQKLSVRYGLKEATLRSQFERTMDKLIEEREDIVEER